MTFIHPALLIGLVLAGLPILLHLILRQKPKVLSFPAFQFLARRATANRRRMRLRHLLLLLLRVGVVVLMCLALARPRIVSQTLDLLSDRPAAAVIVIDTSLSMEYTVAGQTRLDECKKRAVEIIDALPAGSRFAVIDSSDAPAAWQPNLASARERVATLEPTQIGRPLTDGIAKAYRLFSELAKEIESVEEQPTRFVFVLTDRTPASWDTTRTAELIAARDKLGEPAIQHVLVDCGLDKPVDVGLTELRLNSESVSPAGRVAIPVLVQATGQDVETQLQLRLDGVAGVDTKPVRIAAGQTREVTFERRGLAQGTYRGEIQIATDDALMANNTLYVTLEVGQSKSVLILCDRPIEATTLSNAIKGRFPNVIHSVDDAKIRAMTAADFATYRAVCLLNVGKPSATGLWDKLESYVAGGGGLAIFPGGDEMIQADYPADGAASRLLPGTFTELVSDENGAAWTDYQYQHPIIEPFRDYAQDFADRPPRAFRYWAVDPAPHSNVLLKYADAKRRPAILETTFDARKSKGRVVVATTPFDNRTDNRDRLWNDYFADDWVGLAMANRILSYVCADAAGHEINFISGQSIVVKTPAELRATVFTLSGPGITGGEAIVQRPQNVAEVQLPQVRQAGHYQIRTNDGSWSTSFSVNGRAGEFQLLPRVPVEALTSLFGKDGIVNLAQSISIKDKLDQQYRRPIELFPWLMLILLIVFMVENYVSNRFYRSDRVTDQADTMIA